MRSHLSEARYSMNDLQGQGFSALQSCRFISGSASSNTSESTCIGFDHSFINWIRHVMNREC